MPSTRFLSPEFTNTKDEVSSFFLRVNSGLFQLKQPLALTQTNTPTPMPQLLPYPYSRQTARLDALENAL